MGETTFPPMHGIFTTNDCADIYADEFLQLISVHPVLKYCNLDSCNTIYIPEIGIPNSAHASENSLAEFELVVTAVET